MTTKYVAERYSRQASSIDQEILENSAVLIRGNGMNADFVFACLAGLGIGKIFHEPTKGKGFFAELGFDSTKEMMGAINPLIEYEVRVEYDVCQVIDAGEKSNPSFVKHVKKKKIPYRRISLNYVQGIVSDEVNESQHHHPIISGILAGHIGEEVIKICCKENVPSQISHPIPEGVQAKRILVVGAGASGTYAALQAALSGAQKIDIMDPDNVQAHNLNRQILYWDSVGKKKAHVLSQRVKQLGIESKSFTQSFSAENAQRVREYDVVYSCVDRREARVDLNNASMKYGIPLVDSGTNVNGARILTYMPKKTKCIGCRAPIDEPDVKEIAGCVEQSSPSIIMPNMIAGSIMAEQSIQIVQGKAESGITRYNRIRNSLYTTPPTKIFRETCGCTQ